MSCEVNAVTDNRSFRDLLADMNIEEKLMRNIKLEDTESKGLQICHCNARAVIEDITFGQGEVRITGAVELKVLYTSSAEGQTICSVHDSLPFEVTRELEGVNGADIEQYTTDVQLTQQNVSIKDSSQLEWRGMLNIRVLIYDSKTEAILMDLKLSPIPAEVLEGLPGFAIYYVNNGDSLWQIGKKYYVSVERIKEMNNLTTDEIQAGDKILIVK